MVKVSLAAAGNCVSASTKARFDLLKVFLSSVAWAMFASLCLFFTSICVCPLHLSPSQSALAPSSLYWCPVLSNVAPVSDIFAVPCATPAHTFKALSNPFFEWLLNDHLHVSLLFQIGHWNPETASDVRCRFSVVSAPIQRRFSAVSAPFQRRFSAVLEQFQTGIPAALSDVTPTMTHMFNYQ